MSESLQSRLAYEAKCIENDVSSRSVYRVLLEASDAIGSYESRLDARLERINRLRDWIEDRWLGEECPYGEADFEACGHNRKHGICTMHAAAKVLAQDTFVSDERVVERRRHEWSCELCGRTDEHAHKAEGE